MTSEPIRVLFVCLGNICRSPLAEALFRHFVREAGLEHRFEIDSAGTSDWHEGEPPDRRSAAVARRHGIELTGRSRPITREDLRHFHYVLVMDAQNLRDVRDLRGGVMPDGAVPGVPGAAGRPADPGTSAGTGAVVLRLREFDPLAAGDLDVPDPYYGGERGFELVQEIVGRSCEGLLARLREEHRL